MTYKWKMPGLMPVGAQAAGEELHRIYDKRGRMEAKDIVDESRPEAAVLHPCFEWDDWKAAEEWRKQQARGICHLLVITEETPDKQVQETRAFVRVEQLYHPISVVLKNRAMAEELRETARREALAFYRKFQSLEALLPVFDSMRTVFGPVGFGETKAKEAV